MNVKQFQKEVTRKNKIIEEHNKKILKCQNEIRLIQMTIEMNEWYRNFTNKNKVFSEDKRIKGLYQFVNDTSQYYNPDVIISELKKQGKVTDEFEKFYSNFTKIKLVCGEYEKKSYQIDTLQDFKKEIISLDTVQFCCQALRYATVEVEAKERRLKKELCDFKEGRIKLQSKQERVQKKAVNVTKKIAKGAGKTMLEMGKDVAQETLKLFVNKL